MSIRLHPRHMQVGRAKIAINDAIAAAAESNDLTAGEIVAVLAHITSDYTKYVLRAERHPNDPDKKADEA